MSCTMVACLTTVPPGQILGTPGQVHLVSKPKVSDWTEDLFDAIEAGDVPQVEAVLNRGQDPDCVLIDSALCAAVQNNHYPVVRKLLKGQSRCQFCTSWSPRAFADCRYSRCRGVRQAPIGTVPQIQIYATALEPEMGLYTWRLCTETPSLQTCSSRMEQARY